MAVSHGSSPTKTDVYKSLYLISRATEVITEHLTILRSARVMASGPAARCTAHARELRAEIATSSTHNLNSDELREAG